MSLALAGYAQDAPRLIEAWKSVDHAAFLAPVAHLMPATPARALDIGAGIGSAAVWLASAGLAVLAVEPCDALREAGIALATGASVEWLNDSLPDLAALPGRPPFDFVLMSAVWAHLDGYQRASAMPNLAAHVASTGRLILSIRDGWTPANRPVFPANPDETIRLAEGEGLKLVFRATSGSVQAINRANNVRWHWLAFERLNLPSPLSSRRRPPSPRP